MPKDILLGNKKIGLEQPVFISAEVGTTCNGDVKTSKKLIDAAHEAGMDAVKFQILDPEGKHSDKDLTFTYARHDGEVITEKIVEMLKQYVMSREDWIEIQKYAKEKGIIMFATPDHLEAVDLMEDLGMPAYKIATWDVNYYPFVKKIAETHKPVIVDLGASDLEEVARILDVFKKAGNDRIILLHCFHTKKYEEMNLQTIEYMREAFGCLTGFSAPDNSNDLDYLSLAYGPVYIEKRLTLDRKDKRHHHSQALEPDEMKRYIQRIRELSLARGSFKLEPTQKDLEDRQLYFRRLVAKKDLKKGEIITRENIACRRPLKGGLDPMYLDIVIGRPLKKDLKENEPLTWDKI